MGKVIGMTYDQFINMHPFFDLFFELFKGVIPTIVAIMAIYLNNKGAVKREQRSRKEEMIIKVKGAMLDKLIEATNMYYNCGKIAIECISEPEEGNKKKRNNELFDSLNILYAKSWEIIDYYNTMFVSFHIDINCKEINTNIYEFGNKLSDIVRKNGEISKTQTGKEREEKIKRCREEISEIVSKSTSWNSVIMRQISDSIKYE